MGTKKQQTFAKLQRERKVKERRQLKLEKKHAARKQASADGDPMSTGVEDPRDEANDTDAASPE
jgi:hypothetical protein